MDLALDLYSLSVVLTGLAIGAFVKGLTGMGLPLIAVPFLAGFVGVEHAIVVMQIPGLVSNFWLIGAHSREAKSMTFRADLILPALFMTVVGVWFLDTANDQVIVLLLAVAVAAFLAFYIYRPAFKLDGRVGHIITVLASSVGGFVQGASGVSGPLFSTMIFSLRLSKSAYVLHSALLFGLFNAIQAVTMIFFGMWTWQRLIEGCLALIPLFAFQYAGMRMMGKIKLSVFNRVVLTVIIIMELKLLWEGLRS